MATQTGLIPDLLSSISDLLIGQPAVPTPAVTSRPSVGRPAPGVPDLLDQLSSLLASVGAPVPTGPGVAAPSVPAQGIPSRSGASGVPGFLTSVIPGVSGVPAGSGQPAIAVPTLAAEPAASVFNPRSPDNVAVNYGQPETVEKRSLSETCADPNIDIVILGFLTHVVFGDGIYPRLQLVCPPSPVPPSTAATNEPEQSPSFTSTQTSLMKQLAPGLAFYPTFESDITQCQTKYGKKIFLSIGGAGNSLPLASDQAAITFADRVWELFGPAGHVDPALRPFGSAVLDGFDLSTSPPFSLFPTTTPTT